jgi:hypothetical protein
VNDPRSLPPASVERRPRPHLVAVPSEAEVAAFERFLAAWLAEAAERRIRRQTAR